MMDPERQDPPEINPQSGGPRGPGEKAHDGQQPQGASGSRPKPPSSANSELAQALKDLARGEQAASALEAELSTFEQKLDAILAAMGQLEEEEPPTHAATGASGEKGG